MIMAFLYFNLKNIYMYVLTKQLNKVLVTWTKTFVYVLDSG